MSSADYSDVSYWEQRYAVDVEPYEFYQQPAALRSFILPLILSRRPHSTQQQRQCSSTALTASLLLPQQSSNTAARPQPLTRSPSADSGHRRLAGVAVKDSSSSVRLQAASGPVDDGRLRVLVLGCGSSELSAEVWRMLAGGGDVLSIDFSVNCVEEMQKRHSDKPGMSFSVCDVRRLPYPSEQFDLILDKGCLDCLHCSDSATVRDEVKAAVSGLQRCLKVKGTLLSLSHSPPEQRSACFLLDRTEMLLELLHRERQEKESRRAAQQANGGTDGSAAQRRSASALSSARASVSSGLSTPLAGFSQPVVLRLDKQAPPSPAPRRSSVSSGLSSSTGGIRPSVSSNAADVLSERAEAEAETLSAAASASDVEAQLNLSAVEEAEHYLYLCTKDLLPNGDQDAARPSARALTRRSSLPDRLSPLASTR